MNPTSLHHGATRGRGRRLAFASAVSALALVGAVGLGLTHSGALAQLKAQRPIRCRRRSVARRCRSPTSSSASSRRWSASRSPTAPRWQPTRRAARAARQTRPGGARGQPVLRVLQAPAAGVPRPADAAAPTQAQGSGFVISADGYVVTNNHVIDGANKITVNFDQDTKYEAELIGTDPRTDLALLKIKGGSGNFPHVKFCRQAAARRRLGGGGRQSVRSRRHGDGRYRLRARPRHRLGSLRLHADRRRREPRQLGRPDLQPRRRGGGRQHRHLQPVGRQRRHRLRRAGQGGNRGDHAAQVRRLGQPRLARREDPERRRGHGGEPRPRRGQGCAGQRSHDAGSGGRGWPQVGRRDPQRQRRRRSPTAAIWPARSQASRPARKVDVRILRGQKEQNISVKLGTFPSAAQLAKAEPAAKEDPKTTELDQLGLTLAPGTGPNKDGVLITEVDGNSERRPEGPEVGRRDPRGRQRDGEDPRRGRQCHQGGVQARPHSRSDAGQVRRSDPSGAGTVEEELTPSSKGCARARRRAPAGHVASLRVFCPFVGRDP